MYKDKDILNSVCINMIRDGNTAAVATTRGIKEITLESSSALLNPGQKRGFSTASLVFFSSSESVNHNIPDVQWLEAHPNQPYYLSGSGDGSIYLWQFQVPSVVATYRQPNNPRICRIHFNQNGTKFGACDNSGYVCLWRFASNEDFLRPYLNLHCHTKRTLDFAFFNAGSCIATVGYSTPPKKNLCLWDVLIPPYKACVADFACHEDGGAASIAYSSRHQLLLTGGKKGDICLFDVRQRRLLNNLKAHDGNVKTLTVDPLEEVAVSGSSDGSVKVWDLPNFESRLKWSDVHERHTFVRPGAGFNHTTSVVSTYGVMQVNFTSGRELYSCGSDGRVLRTPLVR